MKRNSDITSKRCFIDHKVKNSFKAIPTAFFTINIFQINEIQLLAYIEETL